MRTFLKFKINLYITHKNALRVKKDTSVASSRLTALDWARP